MATIDDQHNEHTPAPAEALSREQLEALKGHTPAPWAWRGYPTHRDSVPKHPYLRSEVSPRYIVMDFVRQGMQGAQPRFIHRNTGAGIMRPVSEMGAGWAAHPDARLIAAAPDLLTTALAALARAKAAEARVTEALAAIDAAIQCETDLLDMYQRRTSLTTLDLAVADLKRDSLPKLKAARAALAGSPS